MVAWPFANRFAGGGPRLEESGFRCTVCKGLEGGRQMLSGIHSDTQPKSCWKFGVRSHAVDVLEQ